MKNFLIILFLITANVPAFGTITLRATSEISACESAKNHLREGDLVFIQIDNIIYRKLVAEVTDSWTSHVGIVFKDKGGNWIVSESTFPWSKETELCKYLKRTKGTRFAIRRLPGLGLEQVRWLKNAADFRQGLYYDTGFDFEEEGTSFCSKFTYEIFLDALDVKIGRVETLAEIRDRKLAQDPDYDYSFVYLWFMRLKIPWERKTVTPESQYSDAKLKTILESY